MKNFWLVRPGKSAIYAKDTLAGNYVGVGFFGDIDLSTKLSENWREFNAEMIPVWLEQYPDKSKVAAGLACGNLWTVAKGMQIGDIVLSPQGNGTFGIAEVIGDYTFSPGTNLPHRRAVHWGGTLSKEDMSEPLRNTSGSIMTAFSLNKHTEELTRLIENPNSIITTDTTIEDPSVFALEKHLEDFLVHNWAHTELGKKYKIYEVDGEIIGQQYPSDTGPLDILAISNDGKELLIVELKRGRTSDVVVGQIQRYMGYVKDELAEDGQKVSGVIIALDDDIRIRRALSVATNISFMTYEIKFKLNPVNR